MHSDAALSAMRWQPREHIVQVLGWIMPIELGTLNQAHDGGRSLARHLRSGKQPVLSTRRPCSCQFMKEHEVSELSFRGRVSIGWVNAGNLRNLLYSPVFLFCRV